LDDIDESFHSGPAKTSGGSGQVSKDTPEGVFDLTRSLLNEEIVSQVKATFLFDASGKYPGKAPQLLEGGTWDVGSWLSSLHTFESGFKNSLF